MVGMYKISADPDLKCWIGQVHAVIAGFEKKHEVREAFRLFNRGAGQIWIEDVRDSATDLAEVLRTDVCVWQWPGPKADAERPAKKLRSEFYSWQLRILVAQRLIRYGCDRYFNRIIKKPKVITAKPKKPRPYPIWLRPYMYGTHHAECTCRICLAKR